jgi:molybdenum cofactor cytidylyltransferase
MSVPLNRAAIILLASGLSRRYGNRDKLTANLGGKHLIEHSASELAKLPALTRVAVTPTDRNDLKEHLINRFVIALNRKPKHGLGHSIAVGVQVALQFKPDAIVVCMGDMPFIEGWLVEALLAKLGDADIVHAGGAERVHPPTAFGAACFDQLKALDGDDGAKRIIGQGGFRVAGLNAPAPILVDVDTREELEFAKRQLALRDEIALRAARPVTHASAPVEPVPDPAPLSRLSATRR